MASLDAGSVARAVARADELGPSAKAWTADMIVTESRAVENAVIAGDDSSESLARSLVVCREAMMREAGVYATDSAVAAAAAMAAGTIVETRGGTDTLTALSMCVYWYSLIGDGVHLVAEDEHDADNYRSFLMPALRLLGNGIGFLPTAMGSAEKRNQYSATITVGTRAQFAADYLEDNLQDSVSALVQRKLSVAVLGDACRTLVGNPLEVTYLTGSRIDPLADSAKEVADRLRRNVDYSVTSSHGGISFSASGMIRLRRAVYWRAGSLVATTLAQQIEEVLLFREGLVVTDRAVFADITTQGYFRNYFTLVGSSHGQQGCASNLARMYNLDLATPVRSWRFNWRRHANLNEPSWTDLPFERVIDEQRGAFYQQRAEVRDSSDVGRDLRTLVSDAVRQWSVNGADGIILGMRQVMGSSRVDREIAPVQGSAHPVEGIVVDANRILGQAIADRRADVGLTQMDELIRSTWLAVLDQQWSRHLARVRFIQRHGNFLDSPDNDASRRRSEEIRQLYAAGSQLIREYVIGYVLNAEIGSA